jgi:outer membrane beta-barrel protein
MEWFKSLNGPVARMVKRWGLKFALIVFAVIWLTLIASTWAESAQAGGAEDLFGEGSSSASGSEQGEYSFKWLDPDKKIYVLQNRKFSKANHLHLSVLGGVGLSNSYRSVEVLDPRLSYYFTESWGVEFFYTKSFNSDNNTYKALANSQPGTWPVIRDVQAEYGATLQWVPWYAKINVFNKIIYFDWLFGAGAGMIQTAVSRPQLSSTTQNFTAFNFETGHIYHLTQMTSIRLDLKGSVYRAMAFGTQGDSVWFSNYNLGLGFGLSL